MRFLQEENQAQINQYNEIISEKASVLKSKGKIFVGKFLNFKDGVAIFKVFISNNMPSKNSFWVASCFSGEMGKHKNWGDYSWADLREKYQIDYSDAFCAWLSKSDNPEFALVGVKGITISFANLLEKYKPIIAFGPQLPPTQYLLNLYNLVKQENALAKRVLYFELSEPKCWNPLVIKSADNLTSVVLKDLDNNDFVAIQGPPGTGKTYKIAQLIADLLSDNKSVLVTALTNQALKEIAKKDSLKQYVDKGCVCKTSLTMDELKEVPNLRANEDNSCNATNGNLSLATFYLSSGWADNIGDDRPFDYVIMDEASQAVLPMMAASLLLGKKVIWIGDQAQLSPIVVLNEDFRTEKGYTEMINGFETICNHIQCSKYKLCETFRLTERAAGFTGIFYDDELKSVSEYNSVNTSIPELHNGGGPSLKLLDFKVGDVAPTVAFEYVFDLTSRLLKEQPKAEIAILCKFKEFVQEAQRYFVRTMDSIDMPPNVRISTVDSIQGLTVDYTLFVIPDYMLRRSLEEEFFNVATSRARYSTVIVSFDKLLKNHMSQKIRRFILKINEGKVAAFNDTETLVQKIASGNIGVTVLGKINLPEKHFKEIVEDKENVFVIDTNVFVKCPSIISKIGKYKVVIPTTVLEELDHLKMKPEIDKKALSEAAKNINLAFQKQYSYMESGDSSLLPIGFDRKKADCLILSVALKYKNEGKNAILLTSDQLLQSKALGLEITVISLSDFLKERKYMSSQKQ